MTRDRRESTRTFHSSFLLRPRRSARPRSRAASRSARQPLENRAGLPGRGRSAPRPPRSRDRAVLRRVRRPHVLVVGEARARVGDHGGSRSGVDAVGFQEGVRDLGARSPGPPSSRASRVRWPAEGAGRTSRSGPRPPQQGQDPTPAGDRAGRRDGSPTAAGAGGAGTKPIVRVGQARLAGANPPRRRRGRASRQREQEDSGRDRARRRRSTRCPERSSRSAV